MTALYYVSLIYVGVAVATASLAYGIIISQKEKHSPTLIFSSILVGAVWPFVGVALCYGLGKAVAKNEKDSTISKK